MTGGGDDDGPHRSPLWPRPEKTKRERGIVKILENCSVGRCMCIRRVGVVASARCDQILVNTLSILSSACSLSACLSGEQTRGLAEGKQVMLAFVELVTLTYLSYAFVELLTLTPLSPHQEIRCIVDHPAQLDHLPRKLLDHILAPVSPPAS